MPFSQSLFSLEIVVERIFLHNLANRIPQISFKLLDYPLQFIDVLLFDKGNIDYSKISLQIKQLLSCEGKINVRKGKSCLFRSNAYLLLEQLRSTPLYVMVLDLMSNPAMLIGSSTIILLDIFNKIIQDIEKFGLSNPTVHGEKGLFRLLNLVGNCIGEIEIGYRIYSLGCGLLAHVSEKTLLAPIVNINNDNEVLQKDNLQENNCAKVDASVQYSDQNIKPIVLSTNVRPKDVLMVDKDIQVQSKDSEMLQKYETHLSKKIHPPILRFVSRKCNNVKLDECSHDFVIYDDEVRQFDFEIERVLNDPFGDMINQVKVPIHIEDNEKKIISTTINVCEENKIESKINLDVPAENVSNQERLNSSKLHTNSKKCSKHRYCKQNHVFGVPTTKSWIRTEPQYKSCPHKTKVLNYGLTNSYKIKLQHSNPDLYRTLQTNESVLPIPDSTLSDAKSKKASIDKSVVGCQTLLSSVDFKNNIDILPSIADLKLNDDLKENDDFSSVSRDSNEFHDVTSLTDSISLASSLTATSTESGQESRFGSKTPDSRPTEIDLRNSYDGLMSHRTNSYTEDFVNYSDDDSVVSNSPKASISPILVKDKRTRSGYVPSIKAKSSQVKRVSISPLTL